MEWNLEIVSSNQCRSHMKHRNVTLLCQGEADQWKKYNHRASLIIASATCSNIFWFKWKIGNSLKALDMLDKGTYCVEW